MSLRRRLSIHLAATKTIVIQLKPKCEARTGGHGWANIDWMRRETKPVIGTSSNGLRSRLERFFSKRIIQLVNPLSVMKRIGGSECPTLPLLRSIASLDQRSTECLDMHIVVVASAGAGPTSLPLALREYAEAFRAIRTRRKWGIGSEAYFRSGRLRLIFPVQNRLGRRGR